MQTNEQMVSRLTKSARALVAFFSRQLQSEVTLLATPPAVIGPEHVVFQNSLNELGFWGLRAGRAISSEDRGEIAATFASILGGETRTEAQLTTDRLTTTVVNSTQGLASNVISMTVARRRRQFPVGEVVGPAAKRVFKRDCLIECPDVRETHKLAFELHARGSRFAFIPFADLEPKTRVCFTSLLNLGPVTLFVPDLLALTMPEQAALHTLVDFYFEIRPLVIAGTRRPLSELRAHPGVDPGLLEILARSHLRFFGTLSKDHDLTSYLDQLEDEDEG